MRVKTPDLGATRHPRTPILQYPRRVTFVLLAVRKRTARQNNQIGLYHQAAYNPASLLSLTRTHLPPPTREQRRRYNMATMDMLIKEIYFEKQEEGSMLCAQHALNSLLRMCHRKPIHVPYI